jgi:hypothetical protein
MKKIKKSPPVSVVSSDTSKFLSDNNLTQKVMHEKDKSNTVNSLSEVPHTAPPTILEPETKVGIQVLDEIIEWSERVPFGKYAADDLKDKDYYVASIDALQKTALERGSQFR